MIKHYATHQGLGEAMDYSFSNPTLETLRDFFSVNSDKGDEGYQHALTQLERGEYDLSKRWLFTSGGVARAALVRAPVPQPIYRLRTSLDLDEAGVLKLLEFAATLSEGEQPATLNYSSKSSHNFSALAQTRGWTLEAHVKGYDADLGGRDDLKADPTALSFDRAHLKSQELAAFYKPI